MKTNTNEFYLLKYSRKIHRHIIAQVPLLSITSSIASSVNIRISQYLSKHENNAFPYKHDFLFQAEQDGLNASKSATTRRLKSSTPIYSYLASLTQGAGFFIRL